MPQQAQMADEGADVIECLREDALMVRHGIDLSASAVQDFCRRWKIAEMAVFGSILRDDFGPDSDVDFLVEWSEDAEWDMVDHIEMEEELGAILGRRVDLVARSAVEGSLNRLRRKHILSTAEPVIASR